MMAPKNPVHAAFLQWKSRFHLFIFTFSQTLDPHTTTIWPSQYIILLYFCFGENSLFYSCGFTNKEECTHYKVRYWKTIIDSWHFNFNYPRKKFVFAYKIISGFSFLILNNSIVFHILRYNLIYVLKILNELKIEK